MAEGEDPRLKATKAMIRSVVMSVKEGVPASHFVGDYMEFTGETIPYKALGYSSLDSFIKSIPDVVCVRVVRGVETYFAVADGTTQHLQNLIQRQKSNPKKSKGLRKGPPTRYPKVHSQLSKTPPSGGGAYRPGPPFGRPSNQTNSFGRQRPILGATPVRVRSPILPTPFHSENLSPLTVTIRNRGGEGDRERVIERRGGNGGRHMAQRALKDVVGQRQQDKKSLKYELPPRFQKRQNGGKMNGADSANVGTNVRPVAVVQPNLHGETDDSVNTSDAVTDLPNSVKTWAAELLKEYPSGLWSTRFSVLYSDEFGHAAPVNLMDIVQTWTDIARVELNRVANRYVIYPLAKKSEEASEAGNPFRDSAVGEDTAQTTPFPEESTKQWQDFIVPVAVLFEPQEEAKIYASTSTDLSDFYVQRADSCAEEITENLLEIEKDMAVPKPSDLQPGVFCAALYSQDESWYRARVLCLKSDTEVHIIFIDYGNVETVSINDIRCLTEEIASIPAQAINCTMYGLKPFPGEKGWSEQAKMAFHNMLNEKALDSYTHHIENGSCVVELWPEDSDTSLNEQLFKEGLVDTYLSNRDPPDLELPQEGYLEVIVAFVDLKHCWLRIIGKDYSETLEAFEDKLAALYKEGQGQPKRLQEHSVCIAHCDLLYHRVKIKEILHNQANCFFVDHGYTEWFPLDQLVPLDKDINHSLPYQAVWCVLVGLEVYMSNPITITELVERSKNKICVAEVIVRDPLKVMLYDTHGNDDININEEIAKKLVAEGHVIDMSLFSPISDNASESSRASSPRPVPSAASTVPDDMAVPSTTNIEQLQSGAQTLTLNDTPVNKDSVIGDSANASVEVNSRSSEQTAAASSSMGVSQPDSVQDSAAPVSAGQLARVGAPAMPYGDSLSVAYNTWPLPPYVALPEFGVFFAVFVQSVVDPSNFVVVPHHVLGSLEDMMMKMNVRFNPDFGEEGDGSAVQTPTAVPNPQANHLYMAIYNGVYYRAIYLATSDDVHHVLLPDYCYHVVIAPEEIFFLPKPFWSTPFVGFRASLFGIKPVGRSEKFWNESVKYKFMERTLSKTLMAIIKRVETGRDRAEGGGDGDSTLQSSKRLKLHLVDTSDPDTDVVISELLLATCTDITSED